MKLIRVVSRKTGRVGYRWRGVEKFTGRRPQLTEWNSEKLVAEKAILAQLEALEKQHKGLPTDEGWQMPYVLINK